MYTDYENEKSTSLNDSQNNEEPNFYDSANSTKKALPRLLVIIIILLIVFLIFFLIKKINSNKVTKIEFKENNIQLVIGETKNIELIIEAKKPEKIPIAWSSDNLDIATIQNGTITAINEGFTIITAKYTAKNGKEFIAECPITVINNKPTIKYEISNNNWTNKDVTISVNAESKTNIDELKYALNCEKDCNYTNIDSNQITINEPGINKVYIIATTKNNVSTQEVVEVKIDKTPPEIKLVDKNTTYSGVNKVEVCATCKDNESGCKQEKICKKFTDDKTNETIEVTDKAGNVSKTESFNVKINKTKPVCKFTEPENTSFKIDETINLTLECSDSAIGIKDTDLKATDFSISSSNILQITNIEKTKITNGFKYVLTIKGIATGTSKITLNKDVIYSNSGLAHDVLSSKDYTVTVACTRRKECGCESSKWIYKETFSFSADLGECHPTGKPSSYTRYGHCFWNDFKCICEIEESVCQEYKCC